MQWPDTSIDWFKDRKLVFHNESECNRGGSEEEQGTGTNGNNSVSHLYASSFFWLASGLGHDIAPRQMAGC